MKHFTTTLLLATAAYAVSVDQATEADTGAYSIDMEASSKFIGRIKLMTEFDPWVNAQSTWANDPNKNPCAFSWLLDYPFANREVFQEALYISHNCPKELVEHIKFKTQLPEGTQVARLHGDDTVRTIDSSGDSHEITSVLSQPKVPGDDSPANDDAFLFAGNVPDGWCYGYDVCLTGEPCSLCEFSQTDCDNNPAFPHFNAQECLCTCNAQECQLGFTFDVRTCMCIPESSSSSCDKWSPNYSLDCEVNPRSSAIALLNCDWFLVSNTDVSMPAFDFDNATPGNNPPKSVGGNQCLLENGEQRSLFKYSGTSVVPSSSYDSGRWIFYETPFTTEENRIYWIQAFERKTLCPEQSFLAWNNDECELGSSRFDLGQVSIFEKTFWQVEKHQAVDLISQTACVYYTINAWDPEGTEGACSTNEYKIDLFDRSLYMPVGYGNQSAPTPSKEHRFKLEGLRDGLLTGEQWCRFL